MRNPIPKKFRWQPGSEFSTCQVPDQAPWHIRRLCGDRPKFTGVIGWKLPTTLCGMRSSWDVDVNVERAIKFPSCCCTACVRLYKEERDNMNVEFNARKCACCGREELRVQSGMKWKTLTGHERVTMEPDRWWCPKLWCQLDRIVRGWRRLNHLYAQLTGYFWLPCPICGEMFGGHECGTQSLLKDWYMGDVVCNRPACNEEAKRRNQQLFSRLRLNEIATSSGVSCTLIDWLAPPVTSSGTMPSSDTDKEPQ